MNATVDEGNIVVFERWPENFNEQQEKRVCGAVGRTSWCDNEEKMWVRRAKTQTSELQFSGGQREPDVEEIRDAVRPKQK